MSKSQSLPFDEPLAVSPKQAQSLLGIGNTTFYALIKQDRIKTFKVGKKRLVNYASLKSLANGDPPEFLGG